MFQPPRNTRDLGVDITQLETTNPNLIGLLPQSYSKLPKTIWQDQDALVIKNRLLGLPVDIYPAGRNLLNRLLLAKAVSDEASLLLRLDVLIRNGAVKPAFAILDSIDINTPALFSRYFNTALLLGQQGKPCQLWADNQTLSHNPSVRVYCFALLKDWQSADINYYAYNGLGAFSDLQSALLLGFLEPELIDDSFDRRVNSKTITPLEFKLREINGAPAPTRTLPLQFSVTDLNEAAAWRIQAEAAERLAMHGAISTKDFTYIFTLNRPAASGGIWDRIAGFQRIYQGLHAQDTTMGITDIEHYWARVGQTRMAHFIARILAPKLNSAPYLQANSPAVNEVLTLTGARHYQVGLANLEWDWLNDITKHPSGLKGPKAGDIIDILHLIVAAQNGDQSALQRAAKQLRAFGFTDLAEQLAVQFAILGPRG